MDYGRYRLKKGEVCTAQGEEILKPGETFQKWWPGQESDQAQGTRYGRHWPPPFVLSQLSVDCYALEFRKVVKDLSLLNTGEHNVKIVSRQRAFFRSGEPVKLEHRKEQLRTLRNFITENRDALCDAVHQDLKRFPQTTYIVEIANAIQEIDYMLANLSEWTKPTMAQKTVATALDQPMIVKEPLGVVLIVSTWNYPVSMILLPLIPAIAAGNTVIIKPSEVSCNTAAIFEKLIPKYFEPVSICLFPTTCIH
ncbi:hypothetical protein OSTOST_18196 [Ostertagia ostertagi]